MSSVVFINLIAISLFVIVFGLWVWSWVWAYGDAASRGKPGWAVALLVALLAWPVGLLLWLVIRPEHQRLQT